MAEDAYSCLIMSQDHKYGLSAGPGRKDQVIVWDVKKLSKICKLRGFKHSRNGINDVYRMCISADNRYVAATSYMQILIWDLQSRRIVKTITEEGWKTMTVFSNDNRLFAYCPTTYAKRFHVIDVPCDGNRSGSGTDIVFNCMGECKALAFSRMRYDDPQGDYGRQERQRLVTTALMKEAASYTIFTALNSKP